MIGEQNKLLQALNFMIQSPLYCVLIKITLQTVEYTYL